MPMFPGAPAVHPSCLHEPGVLFDASEPAVYSIEAPFDHLQPLG